MVRPDSLFLQGSGHKSRALDATIRARAGAGRRASAAIRVEIGNVNRTLGESGGVVGQDAILTYAGQICRGALQGESV